MNTSQIKAYAPKARRDFINAVTNKARQLGLNEDPAKIKDIEFKGDFAFINGKDFPASTGRLREKLRQHINKEGFTQVMEHSAYTWFNRFMALRYMELHDYLKHGLRVLSNPSGSGLPEILENAVDVDLPGLDKNRIIDLKLKGTEDEEIYSMLIKAQCRALNASMPFLFERIDDETELLLPDNLLKTDSIIRKLVEEIDEESWNNVEIIGWIYQFYISEKKDQVIGKVVKSEDIPAATQLFTPNWIVKYIVQNSLGRLWILSNPNSSLKQKMEYYIEPGEQTPEIIAGLKDMASKSLNPEEITLLDPACGSGHILVEAYDIFKAIYLEHGYMPLNIPKLILEKNLYGLDIDDRAAQLTGFALMMKARQDNKKILDMNPPVSLENYRSIKSSADMKASDIAYALADGKSVAENDIISLINLFTDGKTYGSLITIPDDLKSKLPAIKELVNKNYEDVIGHEKAGQLKPILDQAIMLSKEYDCVVANPPYMGGKYLTLQLKNYLKENYKGFEKDLFSSFIIRNLAFTKKSGQLGFMSPFVWMFISSYEELRLHLIDNATITSLVQLEYSGFDGATVPICTFTVENSYHPNFKGGYVRLSDFKGAPVQGPKCLEIIQAARKAGK
jgi:type I restriction-modification system DNA methylase subunit